MTEICVREVDQHRFRQWLGAIQVMAWRRHYLPIMVKRCRAALIPVGCTGQSLSIRPGIRPSLGTTSDDKIVFLKTIQWYLNNTVTFGGHIVCVLNVIFPAPDICRGISWPREFAKCGPWSCRLCPGYVMLELVVLHKLNPGQNGRHFADDILSVFCWLKIMVFWIKLYSNLIRAIDKYQELIIWVL